MEKNDSIVNTCSYQISPSDFHPLRLLPSGPGETSNSSRHNPRKKRTKIIRTSNASSQLVISNPKPIRKPDPSAPKITRPCTECGRKFWSWKALFGHMRCHPEREWRGIVPPPKYRRPETTTDEDDSSSVTEEDHEVAACLLILASGPPPRAASDNTTTCTVNQGLLLEYYEDHDQKTMADPNAAANCGRFECSSCKKVFGSHQALGGHRASHKNVKGCYAITKSADMEEFEGCCSGDNQIMSSRENASGCHGHRCSICFRVFSSGQALGGHMRCHWEKVEDPMSRVFGFDLNLAAPVDEDVDDDDVHDDASCSYSGLALDLRLGL